MLHQSDMLRLLLASIKCQAKETIGKRTCPFCRQPEPKTQADIEVYKRKRTEANDPVAIREAGKRCYHEGDYASAISLEPLIWEMRKRIIACRLCIGTGKVLRGT